MTFVFLKAGFLDDFYFGGKRQKIEFSVKSFSDPALSAQANNTVLFQESVSVSDGCEAQNNSALLTNL